MKLGLRIALALALTQVPLGTASSQNVPIKLGLIDMYSGPFAFQTAQIKTGFQIAIDEANAAGGVNGRKFELQTADMGTSVENAITEGRRMILNDRLHYVTVGSHAGAALALAKFIAGRDDVFVLGGLANSKHYTANVGGPLIGRANLSTVEMGRILAEHLKKMPEVKRIATIAPDFVFGREFMEDFLVALKKTRPDIVVVRQEWSKMGNSDFTPQVTALQSSPVDMVVSALVSGDVISFLKVAKGFGLFADKTKFFNNGMDLVPLSTYRDGLPEGALVFAWYPSSAIKSTEAERFNAEVKKRTNMAPVGSTLVGYLAGTMLTRAIQKGGDPDNPMAASKAMEEMTFESPVGPVTVRGCDHVAAYNYYLGVVKRSAEFPDGIGLVDVKGYNANDYQRPCEEIMALRGH